jgi:NSS family neurotransmitter:Na+ symporter
MTAPDTEPDDVTQRGLWSNRFMFILAAAGSAIGLGNIWRFPYLVGKYGGGAFVIVYLVCILLVGVPILVAEIMIGREARKNPVGAFRRLSGKKPFWTAVGFLGVASGFVILSYYSVVAGWTLDYLVKSVSGQYAGADWEQISALFGGLVGDPVRQLGWHTVFMGATVAIVIFGIKEGLERWIGVLMPMLFLLLVALVIYGLVSGDARQGLAYLFVPNWKALVTNEVGGFTLLPLLEAMGQAFFTLSLGMGAMITYGSYLGDDDSIPSSALWVAALDTLIAILAGIAIYTILFKYNLDPAQGPGLVFKVLPLAFAQMPGGQIIGVAFFLLLAFAALTSAISLLEVVVAYFIDDRKWGRRAATLIMGAVIWGLGIFSALSYNKLGSITILHDMEGQGMPILDSVDRVANNYMLPIGGLLIALFAGWFLKKETVRKQLLEGGGSERFMFWWKVVIRYVTPVLVALLFGYYFYSQLSSSTGVPACDLARGGKIEKLAALLTQTPAEARRATDSGYTPLHFAALYNHQDTVQLLLNQGVDANLATTHNRATPLVLAAGKDGILPMIKLLIGRGALVNAADQAGRTALHLCASRGDGQAAQFLIEHGADVNARDQAGETPLHLAARHGYKTAARLLLEQGADPNLRNVQGQTPLSLPSIKAHGQTAEVIREFGGVE